MYSGNLRNQQIVQHILWISVGVQYSFEVGQVYCTEHTNSHIAWHIYIASFPGYHDQQVEKFGFRLFSTAIHTASDDKA